MTRSCANCIWFGCRRWGHETGCCNMWSEAMKPLKRDEPDKDKNSNN